MCRQFDSGSGHFLFSFIKNLIINRSLNIRLLALSIGATVSFFTASPIPLAIGLTAFFIGCVVATYLFIHDRKLDAELKSLKEDPENWENLLELAHRQTNSNYYPELIHDGLFEKEFHDLSNRPMSRDIIKHLELAEEYYRKAEAILKKDSEDEDSTIRSQANLFLGNFYRSSYGEEGVKEQLQKAEVCFKRAIADGDEEIRGEAFLNLAEIYDNLGDFFELSKHNRVVEAEKALLELTSYKKYKEVAHIRLLTLYKSEKGKLLGDRTNEIEFHENALEELVNTQT